MMRERGSVLIYTLYLTVVFVIMGTTIFSLLAYHKTQNERRDKVVMQSYDIPKVWQQFLNDNPMLVTNEEFAPIQYNAVLDNGEIVKISLIDRQLKAIDIVMSQNAALSYYLAEMSTADDSERLSALAISTGVWTPPSQVLSQAYLNIPAVDRDHMFSAQTNGGDVANDIPRQVGSIALSANELVINLVTEQDQQSLSIDFNASAISHNWYLNNGEWWLAVIAYGENAIDMCVIDAPWSSYTMSFSSLECLRLEAQEEPRYDRCVGGLPSTDGFEECSELGGPYTAGTLCVQNGHVMESRFWNTSLPFSRPTAWSPYFPDDQWVMPWEPQLYFKVGNHVVREGMRFVVVNAGTWDSANDRACDPLRLPQVSQDGSEYWFGACSNPYRVDAVYDWSPTVYYYQNDIVIYEGQFYRSKWNSGMSIVPGCGNNCRWEGATNWNNATNYPQGSIVRHGGNSYYASETISRGQGNPPSEPRWLSVEELRSICQE